MLRVKDLNAWYGESHVLHGVEFEVREGEVVTLLGRNGAGKTTTMKSIMGLVPRRVGSIEFHGRELGQASPEAIARAGIALCPEERGIFGSLSVTENLMLPPVVAPGGLSVPEIYMMFPNLKERARTAQGTKLSGGEQQMLAIGRALMGNPSLLLMDEPLEGLAPIIVDALLVGLERLKREDDLALLLVEQHAHLALELAQQAVVLDRGAVVFSGWSRDLLADPERLDALISVPARREKY